MSCKNISVTGEAELKLSHSRESSSLGDKAKKAPKQHSKDRLENAKYIWQQNAQSKPKQHNTQENLTVQKKTVLAVKYKT